MTVQRDMMVSALKEVFVPELRKRGFKGSFPHFTRRLPTRIDFLTVQFNSSSGSFVVEIAKSGPNGIEIGFGSELPLSTLNVSYFKDRLRLGSDRSAGRSDHWFEFGPRNYDPPEPAKQPAHYNDIAACVLEHLNGQAEEWWNAC